MAQKSNEMERVPSMPKRFHHGTKPPVHWWTKEIGNLRKACLKARRLSQRARGRPSFKEKEAEFKERRRELKNAIKQSKERFSNVWPDDVDHDHDSDDDDDDDGLEYKTVEPKIETSRAPKEEVTEQGYTRYDQANVTTVADTQKTQQRIHDQKARVIEETHQKLINYCRWEYNITNEDFSNHIRYGEFSTKQKVLQNYKIVLKAKEKREQMQNGSIAQKFCYCNQEPCGKMIQCAESFCPFQWFHSSCVDISDIPSKHWCCPFCFVKKLRPL